MPMVGDTLAGRYRIDAALGAGGTAVVYRAHDLRLERDVAVKVLLPNLARDPLLAGRFDREARALAAAAHPGIVSVYDVDRGDVAAGREPFFVMELCDGGSLADALDEAGGRLSPEVVVPMLGTIAGGLASLHARGVIHRDVKPHNILICGTGAKLADFGLARAEDTTRLTAAGTGAGTLAYLAPELLGGAEPAAAADVYGLGVVAFQALTGRLPRPSTSMVELVDTRLAPAVPVSSVAPGLGRSFDGVVAAALAIDPARRPPPMAFAAGLGQALEAWRGQGHPASRPPPIGRPEETTQQYRLGRGAAGIGRDRDRSRRRSFLGPVIAAGALGVLAAGVILAVLAAGALPGVTGPGGSASGRPSSSTSPSVSPSVSPSASASASPSVSDSASPSPSPTPTEVPVITEPPTPVPTPFAVYDRGQALQQASNLRNAIGNSQAEGFIAERDANTLLHLVDEIDNALAKDDANAAARATQKLADQVDKFVNQNKLANPFELQQTISKLQSALPAPK